jgi:hypothetical protein
LGFRPRIQAFMARTFLSANDRLGPTGADRRAGMPAPPRVGESRTPAVLRLPCQSIDLYIFSGKREPCSTV